MVKGLCMWIPVIRERRSDITVQERYLKKYFDKRLEDCLSTIREYNLNYQELGIFGSYARGDYTTESDIDFCMVTTDRPDRKLSGELRERLDLMGAELLYVTPNTFNNSEDAIYQNIRRDYVRLL